MGKWKKCVSRSGYNFFATPKSAKSKSCWTENVNKTKITEKLQLHRRCSPVVILQCWKTHLQPPILFCSTDEFTRNSIWQVIAQTSHNAATKLSMSTNSSVCAFARLNWLALLSSLLTWRHRDRQVDRILRAFRAILISSWISFDNQMIMQATRFIKQIVSEPSNYLISVKIQKESWKNRKIQFWHWADCAVTKQHFFARMENPWH